MSPREILDEPTAVNTALRQLDRLERTSFRVARALAAQVRRHPRLLRVHDEEATTFTRADVQWTLNLSGRPHPTFVPLP